MKEDTKYKHDGAALSGDGKTPARMACHPTTATEENKEIMNPPPPPSRCACKSTEMGQGARRGGLRQVQASRRSSSKNYMFNTVTDASGLQVLGKTPTVRESGASLRTRGHKKVPEEPLSRMSRSQVYFTAWEARSVQRSPLPATVNEAIKRAPLTQHADS